MLLNFVQCFLARYPPTKPLVVLLEGIVATWKEFIQWQVEDCSLFDFYSSKPEKRSQQLKILQKWVEQKSILFLKYKQFAKIVCGYTFDEEEKRWNETYLHFHNFDRTQTYYISVEFLQGRALTNAIENLNINDAYTRELKKLGHELEDVADQEKDVALGNGGLGRLASCFLDSMATLNLPAWGYGLRYIFGLFKQRIKKEGQQELAEDWLEKFGLGEIARHAIVYPIKFLGQVEVLPNGLLILSGGEVLEALAYDVPIPGHETKNTISLRLWEAKTSSKDFNLLQFDEGQDESTAQLHSKARQICQVLYCGDATESGKISRLKQQFFLCSASLHDIIVRFKERRSEKSSWEWSDFPCKVAFQLHYNHPTLAIQELMRLLMDGKDLGWDEEWEIIFASNVAETSLNTPDAKYVVDSGIGKENEYDPEIGMNVLKIRSTSQTRHMLEKIGLFHHPLLFYTGLINVINEFSFFNVINACCSTVIEQGKQLHPSSIKHGFNNSICVGNALVMMYTKQGNIESAHEIFKRLHERDLIAWNAMITCYAQHGHGKKALEIFHTMERVRKLERH